MNIPVLINQYIATDDEELQKVYIQEVTDYLNNGELSLLEFVRFLGPNLTDERDGIRSKTLSYLSNSLGGVKELSRQDINVLVEFYLLKFDDSLLFVLQGLSALIKSKSYLPSNNEKILNKIISYDPRKHLARVRYETFQILISLSRFEIDESFIKTFIHIASGEKDPRNLLNSFELNKLINERYDFEENSPYIDELFDVCFCYFPISFKPPANDPYKITSEELKVKLRNTLASQSLFAKDCIPHLIEKLTSTNPDIRLDTLLTIDACVEKYKNIEEYWITLWNALKFEILHNTEIDTYFKPTDDELTDNGILGETLTILKKLSNSTMLDYVLDELNQNFVTIKDKSKQSIIILAALSDDSNFDKIVGYLFKYEYFGKFLNVEPSDIEDKNEDLTLNIAKQRDFIDVLGYLFIAYNQVSKPNRLDDYRDHILVFLSQLLNTSSNMEKTLKCKIVQQFIKLIKYGYLKETEMVFTYFEQFLVESVQEMKRDAIVDEIITGLKTIPQVSIINTLLSLLDDDVEQFRFILNMLSELCNSNQVLEILSIRLLNKLGNNKEIFQAIVETLIKLILKVQNQSQFLMNSWYKNFIPQFLKKLSIVKDYLLIELSGDLIGLIIKFIDKTKHQEVLDYYTSYFKDVISTPSIEIGLFNKVLASVDKSCQLEDITSLINIPSDEYLKMQYLQTISLLVNKFVKKTYDISQFELFIWSLKGLLLKVDPIGLQQLQQLLELYKTGDKKLIGKSLQILFIDLKIFQNENLPKPLISKVSNLNVKLLYKQKIFEIVLPELINSDDFTTSFNASSLITENISQKILVNHLSTILPIILKSFENNINQESSLRITQIILKEDWNILQPNLSELIQTMIRLSTNTKVEIRKLALENLILMFEKFDLQRYKDEVLKKSQVCLEDRKRVVRKLTIDLRQILYEYK